MRKVLAWSLVGAIAFGGCSSTSESPDPEPEPQPDPPNHETYVVLDRPPEAVDVCTQLGQPALELDTVGPFGIKRHDTAEDFTVTLRDGTTWQLSEHWSGCESYLFVPSGRAVSSLEPVSIWDTDLADLIARSPLNAHYFFVATGNQDNAEPTLTAMQQRVTDFLAALDPETAAWWGERLHVVADHASTIAGWPAQLMAGIGGSGFAIDRQQRIRLLGSFADVVLFDPALNSAGEWPWKSNLAYAAYEAQHYEYEASREAYLGAQEDVTIVSPWSGEVLADVVETTVTFPDAATMAGFDTFEIDLTMDCPDVDAGEFGNCGAWDYLSHIYVLDADGVTWIELARFITTYHREGRYLVDATAMLAHLKDGGERTIRFTVSPPWNPQAYLTQMDFRLSNQSKGVAPSEATFLFAGGNFNASYNDGYVPIDVPIPASAQKVELWAIITGHGGATFNCAEFCDHQHAFTVGGQTYTKTHDTVGNEEGCIAEIANGMVPNQGGTWWFGRGGWCPGQQVEPYVVDVTGDVTPGQTATVSYEALFNGNSVPNDAGNIVMASWLVVYE